MLYPESQPRCSTDGKAGLLQGMGWAQLSQPCLNQTPSLPAKLSNLRNRLHECQCFPFLASAKKTQRVYLHLRGMPANGTIQTRPRSSWVKACVQSSRPDRVVEHARFLATTLVSYRQCQCVLNLHTNPPLDGCGEGRAPPCSR